MIFFVDFERTAFFPRCEMYREVGNTENRLLDVDKLLLENTVSTSDNTPRNGEVAVKPSVPESAAICFDAKLKVSMRRSRWKGLDFKYRRVRAPTALKPGVRVAASTAPPTTNAHQR